MADEQKAPVQAADEALKQIQGPSVGLLVTGIIGAIFSLAGLILSMLGTSIASLWSFAELEEYERYADIFEGVAGIASSFVGIVVAIFIIYAALKMKELSQYGICLAASILAMIPCISPCCLIGLPIGIWCLVVLVRPEMKAAFH